MSKEGNEPTGDEMTDPGAIEGAGEAPQDTDRTASGSPADLESSADAPGGPVAPHSGVAISTRSPRDPERPRTPTRPGAAARPAGTAATPAPVAPESTAASAGEQTAGTNSPGTEAGAEAATEAGTNSPGTEAATEGGAHLRAPWRPGPNPSGPWRPGPHPGWAYPRGPQPDGTQSKPRTHIRLFTALGAAVLLVGSIVAAAVVLQQHGSSSPPATGGAPGTATIVAPGAATPSASPEAPSPSPTVAATRGPLTASSSPASGDGTVVFSDDFQDRSSGWPTASQSGLMTFAFTSRGYVINATGGVLHHLVYSPSKLAAQQLSVSLTASLASASTGAGLGVTCRRGQGATEVSYELLVQDDGGWFVMRRDGAPSLGALATTLSRGSSAVVPGAAPITVVGMCATLSDGTTTRLVLFAEGKKVVDMVDSAKLSGEGWMGGFLVASTDTPAVATASRYEERDLSK